MADGERSPSESRRWAAVLWAVAGVGVSSVIVQLSLMREMLCVFTGNEMLLGVILGNWLLLTGLGAFLGRAGRWQRNPEIHLCRGLVLLAVLPLAQVFLLRVLRGEIFLPGQAIGPVQTVAASFVVLLPFCLVSGFVLTLACTAAGTQGKDRAIGRVYWADGLGSILGGAAFSFVLIRLFDHLAILYIPAILNVLLAGVVAFCYGRKGMAVFAGGVMAALIALAGTTNGDDFTTAVQYRPQKILFCGNSPYGRLVVTESAGQINFIENGLPVISTNNVQQVEETVHYALAQRPQARRVLLISGGAAGTAKEILKYGTAEVVYLELDPLVVDVGRRFLPQNLDDPRIRVINDDGRHFLRQQERAFDVIIVDMASPSTVQINRFYTDAFFRDARRCLASNGVLSLSLGRYENYVGPEFSRMLSSLKRTLGQSFRNVLLLPGGRVYYLASEGELHRDIAARIQQAGVPTTFMNRYYLDATLTPDRMTDLAAAANRPVAINEDFSPILYYYHLRYWMSQFRATSWLLAAAMLAGLAVYLFRLRPASLAIFASGFAASSLEVVLLLAFQVLCGSVYHQMGIVVTLFMGGLAAGAFWANRRAAASSRKDLAKLGLGLAALSGLIPLVLLFLGSGSAAGSSLAVQVAIGVLSFALAVLVGMQFPLAGQMESSPAAVTASRLYTADFVGACLGALLVSTLLIPLWGIMAVCVLVAVLNGAAAVNLLARKA